VSEVELRTLTYLSLPFSVQTPPDVDGSVPVDGRGFPNEIPSRYFIVRDLLTGNLPVRIVIAWDPKTVRKSARPRRKSRMKSHPARGSHWSFPLALLRWYSTGQPTRLKQCRSEMHHRSSTRCVFGIQAHRHPTNPQIRRQKRSPAQSRSRQRAARNIHAQLHDKFNSPLVIAPPPLHRRGAWWVRGAWCGDNPGAQIGGTG
jgi:hypothetical protein